jgi:hypothetical protein
MPRYWFESRARYFRKNHGWLVKLAAVVAWTSGNALWNLRRVLTGRPRMEPPGFFADFVRFNFLGGR